ncbi:MAG: S1 RNA-binding domain-containing protein [Tenericutes bacterium]|nr:S1 RNA-binding domain-containing protein [Mycoplasmatota bacterium]
MSNFKVGDIVEGQITGLTKYGIFVSLEDNYVGLIHISEVSNKFISDLNNLFQIGNILKVKVLSIDHDKLQVKLSIKKVDSKAKRRTSIKEEGAGFEPLKDKIGFWTSEKLKEIQKKENTLKNIDI